MPRRPCRRGSTRPRPAAVADQPRQRVGQRGHRRSGCGRRRGTSSGSRSTTCRRPGTCTRGRGRAHRRRVERGRGAPRRRRARARSCGAGTRPARPRPTPGSAGASTSRAPRASAAARASSSALGGEVAAHQRARRPHDGELLARDVAQRRAEPARVLEPDVGEHLHARVDDVGGVVAAAEAGLDDGGVDAAAGQLGVGGGGQRLELRDAVVVLERPVDLGRGRRPPAARRRRTRSGSRSWSSMRMRSANSTRCGDR